MRDRVGEVEEPRRERRVCAEVVLRRVDVVPDDVGDAADVPVVRLVARAEVGAQRVVEVVHRDLLRVVRLDQVVLQANVIGERLLREDAVIQPGGVVAPLGGHRARRLNLVPVVVAVVGRVPRPRLVERVDCAVFRLHVLAEQARAVVAVAPVAIAPRVRMFGFGEGVAVPDLVVDLPAVERRMIAVAFQQQSQIARDLITQAGVVDARPAPDRVDRVLHALARDALQIGILLDHPDRRVARPRAQHDLDAALLRQLEDAVEPVPFRRAPARLDVIPTGDQFRRADHVQPGSLHVGGVMQPVLRVVHRRVVAGANRKIVRANFHAGACSSLVKKSRKMASRSSW